MLALTDCGYDVAVPFGENTRYDLIVDDGTPITDALRMLHPLTVLRRPDGQRISKQN